MTIKPSQISMMVNSDIDSAWFQEHILKSISTISDDKLENKIN
jgi:hypothetical protein